MRIRFRQVDVLRSVVWGPDAVRGFPLPPPENDDGLPWEPFQIEATEIAIGPIGPGSFSEAAAAVVGARRLRIAVWERLP